jgi:hypothetical protein
VTQWVRSLDLTAHTAWARAQLCKLQKRCTRLAAASDKVNQLLAQGRWFSPGTPASSTTKTGRHNIAEILMKVALNTKKSINQSINLVKKVYKKKKTSAESSRKCFFIFSENKNDDEMIMLFFKSSVTLFFYSGFLIRIFLPPKLKKKYSVRVPRIFLNRLLYICIFIGSDKVRSN